MEQFPSLNSECFDKQIVERLAMQDPPRILILYGSVRERSYSRFAAEEVGRLLTSMGAEVRVYNHSGLPLLDDAPETHPKVVELRELVRWCDGMVWSSPERHGAMSSVMKAQIDWIPLSEGAVRTSQGKTLAVMQVCGGRSRLMQSIRCESSDGGCECSLFPTSHQWQKPGRNSTRTGV